MPQKDDIIIAGAGLSGAVLAQQLAAEGLHVIVADMRDHVAGNCHTERCAETGVLVHRHGPHIFHTDDVGVWDLVNRFARFRHFRHRVFTTVKGCVYSLPVNLATINQFYGQAWHPAEARTYIGERCVAGAGTVKSFEDQALAMIGPELYDAFFKGYTHKQWGCSPDQLPAHILKRLPLRFSYDDSYFKHHFQGLPENGYTAMVEAILDHPNITVSLNTCLSSKDTRGCEHMFWTGPLDGYFDYDLGLLGYRTLDFEHSIHSGDWQGCPVMNYGNPDVPWTRITEHKHFAPWEEHKQTVVTREYSRACTVNDVPYYPIRLAREKELLAKYVAFAEETENVTFVGRLGTYRYLDMDVCVREAMDTAKAYIAAREKNQKLGAFMTSPLS